MRFRISSCDGFQFFSTYEVFDDKVCIITFQVVEYNRQEKISR